MNRNHEPGGQQRVLNKCVLRNLLMAAAAATTLLPGTAGATDEDSAATAVNQPASKKSGKGAKGSAADDKTTRAAAPVCHGEFPAAVTVAIPEGKSTSVDLAQLGLPAPGYLRAVADPEVVQMEPMTSPTARSMFFAFGKKVGSTNLIFQHPNGRCAMVEVSVGIDTKAVQNSLAQLLPAEKNLKIASAADSLVISGMVSDAVAADKVLNIAQAFVRKSSTGGTSKASERIVNMMTIGAPQQVMLEVKVAEISKTLLDKLGVGLNASSRGGWSFGIVSNFLSGGSGAVRAERNGGNDFFSIDAEKKNGLVKILAEPTVMAISGQDGSFLAGGKIFIPVAQDANGKVHLEEKEFGVGLRFTPTVLDGGRINLKVAPEVSELSREGVGISSGGAAGNAVLPLITTRRAATTVQLYDGQSFAIGGLIKNNITESVRAMPVLGEVPVLGTLFRSSDFQNDRTELVFIVTPRLVKPLPPNYPLPTDSFIPPTREEFFLQGRMEGRGNGKQAAASGPYTSRPSAPPTGFELK